MLIATRNGASRYVDEILSFAKSNNSPTLLIADEVHRLLYAEQYGRVLGLSVYLHAWNVGDS